MMVGGVMLRRSVGNRKAMRFWQVSLLACFLSLWAFGPHTPCFDWNFREYFPYRVDGIEEEKRAILAPDLMAGCILYILLWNSNNKTVVALWFIMDAAYYGLMALAMPFSLFLYFNVVKGVKSPAAPKPK